MNKKILKTHTRYFESFELLPITALIKFQIIECAKNTQIN